VITVRLYNTNKINFFSCQIEDWENKYQGCRGGGAYIR
jgi:hypothetical protein